MAIKENFAIFIQEEKLPLCEPFPPSFSCPRPFLFNHSLHRLLPLDCHHHHLSRLPFFFFKQPAPPTSSPSPSHISDQRHHISSWFGLLFLPLSLHFWVAIDESDAISIASLSLLADHQHSQHSPSPFSLLYDVNFCCCYTCWCCRGCKCCFSFIPSSSIRLASAAELWLLLPPSSALFWSIFAATVDVIILGWESANQLDVRDCSNCLPPPSWFSKLWSAPSSTKAFHLSDSATHDPHP